MIKRYSQYENDTYVMEDNPGGEWVKCAEVKPLLVRIIELKEENKQFTSLFDLQHKRSLKADKLWKKATGNAHILPDLGVLLEWLMDQRKIMLKALKEISAELKLSNDQNTLAIDGCHMNILIVWDEIDKLIELQEKK